MSDGATTSRHLLEETRELGRLDGRFAAALERNGASVEDRSRCLGRVPAEFAALLWDGRPGSPRMRRVFS